MEITRDNYEVYFIDYLEGNLEESVVDDFIEFLKVNPDLKEELDGFEAIPIAEEELVFEAKDKLYKERLDVQDEFDMTAAASIDNNATPEAEQELKDYIKKHPEKEKEYKLFGYTKLKPDESIIFEAKHKLRKKSGRQLALFYSSRIAAVVILLLAIGVVINQFNKIDNTEQLIVESATVDTKVPTTINVEEKTSEEEIVDEEKNDKKKSQAKPAKKPVVKPPVKTPSRSKQQKSIRENNRGRIDEKAMLAEIVRDNMVPPVLQSREASIVVATMPVALAPMDYEQYEIIDVPYYYDEKPLLAERLGIKKDKPKFRFRDITKAGLNIASGITKDKFTFDTNNDGRITEVKLETRLFAFSIPTKNKNR